MERITLYIPTFNRSSRLNKNLFNLLEIVEKENLQSKIDILVGDNCSSDTTSVILKQFSLAAEKSGIKFNYFVNHSNLGFNGNIKEGYLKFEGDYIIYLSDDDNIAPGSLSNYINLILNIKPSVALINFNQSPYGINSPLYKTDKVFDNFQLEFFKPLIQFPKLTGIALKKPTEHVIRKEIAEIVIPSFSAAHVSLAIYQYSKFGNGLHVSNFFGYPDVDYLQHITFLPYVSNLFRIEIEYALNESANGEIRENIKSLLDLIPNRVVIEDSIYLLHQYYLFRTNLTKEVFSELWSNCFRYLLCFARTSSGLSLRDSTRKMKRLKIAYLILLMVKNYFLRLLNLNHAKLGEKGF